MIKPCPFCGNIKSKAYRTLDYTVKTYSIGPGIRSVGKYVYHIICSTCGTQGPYCKDKNEAIKYWDGMMNMYQPYRNIDDLYE